MKNKNHRELLCSLSWKASNLVPRVLGTSLEKLHKENTVFEPHSPWPVVTFIRDIGLRPANRCSVNTRSSRHVTLLMTLLKGSSWEGKRKNGRTCQKKQYHVKLLLNTDVTVLHCSCDYTVLSVSVHNVLYHTEVQLNSSHLNSFTLRLHGNYLNVLKPRICWCDVTDILGEFKMHGI